MKPYRWHWGMIAACLVAGASAGWTEDLGGRFGVSGQAAAAWPMAPSYITDTADSTGFLVGAGASYDFNSQMGLGISFDHLGLGNGLRADLLNMLFRFRFLTDRTWVPTFEFGPGSAKSVNSDRIENFALKTSFGLDYFLTPEWAVGPQVHYFFISHSGDAQTYVHLLTFGARASYYFKTRY